MSFYALFRELRDCTDGVMPDLATVAGYQCRFILLSLLIKLFILTNVPDLKKNPQNSKFGTIITALIVHSAVIRRLELWKALRNSQRH